ncbi:MAG: hypothetical protein ACOCVZ_02045 [Gemmatimonadota bacterium]
MPEVTVNARVSDEHYRAYQAEAHRRGVPVETLVEHTVNCLLEELEQEENECRDVLRGHLAAKGRRRGL